MGLGAPVPTRIQVDLSTKTHPILWPFGSSCFFGDLSTVKLARTNQTRTGETNIERTMTEPWKPCAPTKIASLGVRWPGGNGGMATLPDGTNSNPTVWTFEPARLKKNQHSVFSSWASPVTLGSGRGTFGPFGMGVAQFDGEVPQGFARVLT